MNDEPKIPEAGQKKPDRLIEMTESIARMADMLLTVIKTASSAYDRLAQVEMREGSGVAWRMLSVAVCKLRHTLRPKPGTAAFLTEITDYYCANEPRLRLTTESEKPDAAPQAGQKKPEVFHTPKEIIDLVTANPPLGEVKGTPTPIDPSAPEMVYGGGGMRQKTDEDHMSRPEAAHILCRMATSRKVDVDGVVALQMGVRSLMKRHFDKQRNRAIRRARVAEMGDLCHED